MTDSSERGGKLGVILWVSLFILVAVAEIWALFFLLPGSWVQHLTFWSAIFGIYGIALGFFAKAKALSEFQDIMADLTSAHPLAYLAGNFHFLTFVPLFFSVSLSKYRKAEAPLFLCFLGSLLSMALSFLMIPYVLLHMLVIMPLTYIPIVLASSIVSSIVYSARDFVVRSTTKEVSIKAIVEENQIVAKAFIIGIPGMILSFMGKAASFLFTG